jgi:3-oxoacyl-[acyl-carrier protein] reductase
MPSLFKLEGKRVLVLGGGLGIGEATSRMLASLGAAVGVADIDPERAARVADAINAGGGSAMPFAFDALDDDALVAGIAGVERDLGPLDGMASIIGMAAFKPILEMDMATWDLDHRRNLRYFFLAAREVARGMVARGSGSIASVASIDGVRAAPLHAAYGAAKAGLLNLARSMAEEWSPHGVRVNTVASGAIVTPRIPVIDAATEARSYAKVPMGRRGQPVEIAKALTFLLSDMASYVSGETLVVDGGYTAASPYSLATMTLPKNGTWGQ